MINRQVISFIVVFICLGFFAKAQNIITISGTGLNSNDGDDGPATCANMPLPKGLALDGKGFLYLVTSNSIRKIDLANNFISRVAGSDTYGYAGDGGPAKDALMQLPSTICLDKNNNLYVTEVNGNRIRKINLTTGIISTIAGTGNAGFSGDGGPASLAELNGPNGICTDASNNLYVADQQNNRIRKINVATGIITTIAGNGSLTFSGDGGPALNAGIAIPQSIVIDPSGNLFFAEISTRITSRIRKINGSTGTISTIAGNINNVTTGDGGLAVNAELFTPASIALDPAGNIYIGQTDSRIRRIDAATGIINTIIGTGTSGFSGDGGPALSATLTLAYQMTHDSNGNLYVSDHLNNRIRKVGASAAPPPVLPTTISISASDQSICEGMPVTFTAVAVNPGFNAIYEWKVNGNPVNVMQRIFTTSILKDGDLVSCTLHSIVCLNGVQIYNSTVIKMSVKPGSSPAVLIKASETSVCTGTNVVFSAVLQNIGSNATYQWKKNGINVGSSSDTYSNNALADGDTIRCDVSGTSTTTCGGTGIYSSNYIVINVQSGLIPTISIAASDSEVCRGTPITFTATTVNASGSRVYQWLLNGKNVGTNSDIYTNNGISDNDAVACRLTSGTSGCATAPVNSREIRIRMKPSPVISLFPEDTLVAPGTQVRLNAIVSGQYSGFTWSPTTLLISSATLTPQTVALSSNANFKLDITGAEGCSATASSSIRIYRKLFMPNAFSPNGDNVNDVFRIPPGVTITLEEFSIFDRWGNKVFSTDDITKGWDGTFKGSKSPTGSYTFLIRGADDKDNITEKGSVTLIR